MTKKRKAAPRISPSPIRYSFPGRRMMPKSYFLVPGYGAQGGGAKDILPCFNEDGLGAIVNSSRGILFADSTENYAQVAAEVAAKTANL